MSPAEEPILVVAGPTATGKTAAAIALARHFDGEIVGADSVQVYRGFDIGSAKPTAEELGGVSHQLIDVIDPDEEIDAMRYAALADSAIAQIRGRGRLPIVVGGTGLWIRALLRGLVDLPPVDPELRRRLDAEARSKGSGSMHARLAQLDPITAAAVHPNDQMRIVRALEVFEQTGIPLGELRKAHALGQDRYRATFVVLEMDRESHAERIRGRVDRMLEAGWVDEVRLLRDRWGEGPRAFGSVGYREVLAHVRDGVSLEETRRLIYKSTRIYARRQRTWFRGEPGDKWFTGDQELRRPEAFERIARDLSL